MNDSTITQIAVELGEALLARKPGKVFPLSRLSLAIDFRLAEGQFLFISVEPRDPRIYLINRRLKDLERQSVNPSPFVQVLRKRLSGAELESIAKLSDERVLLFSFLANSETGEDESFSLAIQLTGKSANLFLLDHNGHILDRLRDTSGEGQEVGCKFSAPVRPAGRPTSRSDEPDSDPSDSRSLSEKLDEFYREKESAERFRSRAEAERKKLRREISKRQTLGEKLRKDLEHHGDADRWKRYGDLLLANAANAKRKDDGILVTDFYDESLPEIEIEGDRNLSISQIAEGYFKRYTKARNAAAEIAGRLVGLDKELKKLNAESERLESAISGGDGSYFAADEPTKPAAPRSKAKKTDDFKGARSFTSSEGYEILVGKKAKDNDHLTFRVAKSLDLWLHAADYPGSHVVVRSKDRKDVPHKTLLEAAQLAAFYSDAREQPKAAVHYTQKKFVNKPRGSAPGLVRLASFKTILVEPKVPDNKNAA